MKRLASIFLVPFEKTVTTLGGWKHIPNSSLDFMYLCPRKYRGKNITLKDGTIIKKGDIIAELHIDNLRIHKFDSSYANLLKLLKEELIAVKNSLELKGYRDITAVHGITVFHNIAARQGFTVFDIKNPVTKYLGSFWENLLRVVFKKEKSKKKVRVSKHCWLSRKQIVNISDTIK